MPGMTVLLHNEEDVADIHADGALQLRLVEIVAAHGLPVAVESQAHELAVGIEHGAAAVAARDVVVGDEADGHLSLIHI